MRTVYKLPGFIVVINKANAKLALSAFIILLNSITPSCADPSSPVLQQSKPNLPRQTPTPSFKMKADIDRSPSSAFYEPAIELGKPHAKTTIWFYWSAVSADSLSEFRKRIVPAIKSGQRRNIKFVLYQIFDKQFHDMIGPGAYLICPDKYNDYVRLALRYLGKAANVTVLTHADDPGLFYNSYIKQADQGRLWRSKSCQQSNFLTRQVLEVRKSQDFYSVSGDRPFPVYVINGTPYSKDDRELDDILGVSKAEQAR